MMAGGGHAVWEIQELFGDILLRVPLEELPRLRRVSKHWKSYIDGPRFAKKFKEQYPNGPTSLISFDGLFEPDRLDGRGSPYTTRYYMLYHALGHASWLEDFSRRFLYWKDNEGEWEEEDNEWEWEEEYNEWEEEDNTRLQSIEGIVCFDHGELTYLWNPTTSLFKELPTSQPDFPSYFGIDSKWFRTHSALGYDPNTEEHVVLKSWVHISPEDSELEMGKLAKFIDDERELDLAGHKIFRGNAGAWRTLGFKGPIERTHRCICVEGRIYFLTVDQMRQRAIVAFILATEEFLTIPLPQNAMEEPHGVQTELIELGGHVALSDLREAENGNGVAISLYILLDNAGGNWTERQIRVMDDRYYGGFVGSVPGQEVVIVALIQQNGVRELLYAVEEENSRVVNVQVLDRPDTLSVSHAPIHYVPSTLWI